VQVGSKIRIDRLESQPFINRSVAAIVLSWASSNGNAWAAARRFSRGRTPS
jgi:hypothetical protein